MGPQAQAGGDGRPGPLSERRPALVAFAGLPGVGKSTIARRLTARLAAVYLRIDTIEVAISDDPESDIGDLGYRVGFALARENLSLGRDVVADSVNPVTESRAAWRSAAEAGGGALLEVEVVCSDESVHRRRVETRRSDIPGLVQPRWSEVRGRRYEPWAAPPLRVDTALVDPDQAVATILAALGRA